MTVAANFTLENRNDCYICKNGSYLSRGPSHDSYNTYRQRKILVHNIQNL